MAEVQISKRDAEIGKKIRRVRRKVGITQEKLAEGARISTTHIGLVETGKRRMSLKTLQRVARVLGLRVKDLIPF